MAPPTTPAAMPQPYLPAFAALVGMVRLAASVTTARPAAIFDLMFMIGSLRDWLGDRYGPHVHWSKAPGKGSAAGPRPARAVRKVTGAESPRKTPKGRGNPALCDAPGGDD